MGLTAKKEWFYSSLGQRSGPVTQAHVCQLISEQEVYIDATKVWREGMTNWVDLAEVKSFKSYINKVKAAANKVDASVRGTSHMRAVDYNVENGGISRTFFNMFFYVGWLVPMMAGIALLAELQVQQVLTQTFLNKHAWIKHAPLALAAVSMLHMMAVRMKNAGYAKTYIWTLIVPIVNLGTLFTCLCAPNDYSHKKKLGVSSLSFLAVFLIFGGSAKLVIDGAVPGVSASQLSPVALNKAFTSFYAKQTNFTKRYREEAQRVAIVKARRDQRMRAKAFAEKNPVARRTTLRR